eukprot:gene14585-biopygen11680
MELGLKKCALAHCNSKGQTQLQKGEGNTYHNIPLLQEEDSYKYLGLQQLFQVNCSETGRRVLTMVNATVKALLNTDRNRACNRHHHSAYKLRHDQTLIPVLNELLDTMDMGKQVCRERSDPKPEYVGEKGRILRDVMVEPDRRDYRPDMMVYDNENRIITVVELTLPHDTHPEIVRAEKLSKYRSLVADLHNLVIVVGALGTMTVPMTSGIKNHYILGENATQLLKDVQRAALAGTQMTVKQHLANSSHAAVWSDLQCADPHGPLLLGLALQSAHVSPESFNGCSISSDKASRKTAGRWPWKLESTQEYVITHLPNQPALKMDGAQASCLYSAVGRMPQLSKSKGGGGRDATFGADLGEMASSRNLGGSSKYSDESFEDRSRERFHVNSSWTRNVIDIVVIIVHEGTDILQRHSSTITGLDINGAT